jgi:predicted GIY-YIG superfamily endonuclease
MVQHRVLYSKTNYNGRVSDKPRRMTRHQRGQAHNSTLYRPQFSFMYWLCTKQNFLLCAYECDFDDNDTFTIV